MFKFGDIVLIDGKYEAMVITSSDVNMQGYYIRMTIVTLTMGTQTMDYFIHRNRLTLVKSSPITHMPEWF